MTAELWKQALSLYAERGNPSEQLMARMLIDLTVLPSAEPILDGWASRVLEAA